MSALVDAPLAFVDVETTGGHPLYHRVIEVGVVLARGDTVEESWTTLVNPGTRLPAGIQRLTGIDPASLEDAPRFADIAASLAQRLEGRLFIAHNVRFDYGFVRNELQRAGHAFDARCACTVRLSRRFYPQQHHHNLDAVIAFHDLPCAARHRALPDAMALWQFWRRLRAAWPPEALEAALADLTQRVSLPPQLSPGLADELPQTAGVYRFYGRTGADSPESLLYVGRAVNLRERVLGYWRDAPRAAKTRRLASETVRVDWIETAGELGAQLHEARCVREARPAYNRRARDAGEALTWRFGDIPAPPQLQSLADGWPEGDCFGLYRTAREARRALESLAREHRLCAKLLGLEEGEGSCVAFQAQHCRGACVGAEAPQRHLARTKLAFAGERLKPWPYDGAVAIRERDFGGLEQWHVVEGWRYLGTVTRDGPEALFQLGSQAVGFDLETYRVLARYLATHAPRVLPWPPRP
ncbi:MAG: exonuclease domain-containing protein [Steroidobacteraceae bacterium]